MYNHDYDFLWGTFSYITGQSVERRCFCFLRLDFSLFLSFLSLITSFCILDYCYSLCKIVVDLCVGVCWQRVVVDTDVLAARSGWVVAVWDLIQSETKGDHIFSHTRYCEQHNDAWGPCDYTNYDVSGCAYSLDCHNSDSTFFKKRWCFLRGQI